MPGMKARGPDKLTARQKQVYQLRHSTDPPMPFSRMGEQLGMTKGGVNHIYLKTCRKMVRMGEKLEFDGKADQPVPEARKTRGKRQTLEHVRPEIAAALLDESSHALRPSLVSLGRKYGVPVGVVSGFMDRIDRQYHALIEEVRKPRLEELTNLTGARARTILQSITPEDLEQANLRDKAFAASILVEKHLLLEGRPTQIVETREEDQALDKVIGWVLEESQRRGITFDLDPMTGAVNAVHEPGSVSRGRFSGKQHMIESGELDPSPGG